MNEPATLEAKCLDDLIRSYLRTTLHARDAAPRCAVLEEAMRALPAWRRRAIRKQIAEAVADGVVADPDELTSLAGRAAMANAPTRARIRLHLVS